MNARDQFGYWLSGFVDGEGSFVLSFNRDSRKGKVTLHPVTYFKITLRCDDREILLKIHSYWGVGKVNQYKAVEGHNGQPLSSFIITRLIDSRDIIIPHFDRYPLRAKKAGDYEIWRQGVMLLVNARNRPHDCKRPQGGTYFRYTDEEKTQFGILKDKLRGNRAFRE